MERQMRQNLIVDDRPSIVDDQWSDLNVEVFATGDGRSFLTEPLTLRACSCSLYGLPRSGTQCQFHSHANCKWRKKMYQPS